MLQKLMLAVTITFTLNLLFGIRPPADTQTNSGAKVDLAQIVKVPTIGKTSL